MFKGLLKKDIFWVSGVMLFLTAVTTFPLLFRVTRCIPGFISTDEPYGLLWYWWWLKFSFLNGLNPFHTFYLAAPQGVTIAMTIYPLWTLFNFAINFLTNEAFTYNLQMILSFVLSGFFMFRLTDYIARDKAGAFLAGVFYAFCPYHFARSWQHLGLAQIQFMPLYLLLLLKATDNPCRRNLLLAALGLFLVSCFDFYYLYFMGICSIFLVFFIVFYDSRPVKWKAARHVLLALLLGGILSSLPLLPGRESVISGYAEAEASPWSVRKPFDDLFDQSARPLSYFLPATAHPVFGGFTENFAGTALYGSSLTEHTLYLGWVPLLLALAAVRKRRSFPAAGGFHIKFFISLALLAWIFSQPPWWRIGALKILMPSFFMYKLLPMFRAYCRFGIVVMLAISVLAGCAAAMMINRSRSHKSRAALVFLITAAALFEFWSWPPYKVIDVSRVPAAYYWLKGQPSGTIVAEYPLDIDSPDELYKYYQTVHNKKMINASIPGTPANLKCGELANLSERGTATGLRKMGVRFVLLHPDRYLASGLLEDREELKRIFQNPGLKLTHKFIPEDCPDKEIMCTQANAGISILEVKDNLK